MPHSENIQILEEILEKHQFRDHLKKIKNGEIEPASIEISKLTKRPLMRTLTEMQRGEIVQIETLSGGPVFVFHVLKDDKIAIANVFAAKDSAVNFHAHEEIEYMIVYDGVMHLCFDDCDTGEKRSIGRGMSVKIEPGRLHRTMYEENTSFIKVTIPGSPDFP